MTAALLDGKVLAAIRRETLKQRVAKHIALGHPPPGLAVVLLGNDPASEIYVNHKHKACHAVGLNTFSYRLPAETSESDLIQQIDALNQNPAVDGILIQLPLPLHIHTRNIIERILPAKDVDGFHP